MRLRYVFLTIITFVMVAVVPWDACGQYYLFRAEDPVKADVSFVRHSVEAKRRRVGLG